jgi:threonine synthase
MPVLKPKNLYSLGEGWTPLLLLQRLGKQVGIKRLLLKDEGQNPTGTFKSRGLCAAVSKGKELGINDFIMPSAGNAGVALAAYSALSGANSYIIMPEDTPDVLKNEIIALGAKLRLVKGLISDASQEVANELKNHKWYDVSTLKEPYRIEGKKTMGFEVIEQLNWEIPDVIIYPTGGGTGIVGMWKAFDELESIGLIGSERPRMVSVQSSGCAPICRAFREKKKASSFWNGAKTIAPGLCVPKAFGDYLILRSIYESRGYAISVSDSEIITAIRTLAKNEGILIAPEGAATFASLNKLIEIGFIDSSDSIVLFGTGSGFIYPNIWSEVLKK